MKKYLSAFVFLFLLFLGCKTSLEPILQSESPKYIYRILPQKQQEGGDPQKGFTYITEGPYIGSGIPIQVLEKSMANYEDTVLRRSGSNAHLTFSDIAFQSKHGAEVVSGSCFSCHASSFQGSMNLGMGNSQEDFQKSLRTKWRLLHFLIARKVGKRSKEWDAFELYDKLMKRFFKHIITENSGVNPAFRLEEAYFMHRNPIDLSYSAEPQFEMFPFNIASDTPPLWNVKKKEALYYNGMGRGDFTKLLMQASSQGIPDTIAAREVQQNFVDVLAWLNSLEAPKYPGDINTTLAEKGRSIFGNHCATCHGSYGKRETYPNKLVPIHEIQTDSLYARYFLTVSNLSTWYNESWYANSSPRSALKPSYGYIAPPLDGVWATAPYLHNGSVPTLAALLDSKKRPTYWQHGDTYDLDNIGWTYTRHISGKEKKIYDTTLPGYGNQGHYFGDELAEEERKALMEYVKGL